MKRLSEVKKGKKGSVEAWLKAILSDHKTRMADRHREWALTLAWTRGHQNYDYNKRTKSWVKTKRNPWQTRLISNLMLPLVRNKVSRYYTPRPLWDVLPATPDHEDISISKTSSKILQYEWVKQDMTRKLIRKSFWQSTCSSCFLKVGWDTERGDEVEIDTRSVDQQVLDQFLKLQGIEVPPEIVKVKTGELFIDVVTPFNMIMDPMVSVFEESNYCVELNLRSIDWVVSKYGSKWIDKLSETTDSEMLVHPYRYVSNEDAQHVNKRGILVKEVLIKPGVMSNLPKGLRVVVADDQLLERPKDFPFDHGELPYAHFIEIYDPISPWGTCVAEQIRPNQARYNRIQSVLTDHINLTSKVQWLIPRSSQVRQITNKPGENIYYSGGVPPTQTKPQGIPVYVENTLERTRRDMQDTSSFHNVSQGQSEQGVRSGRQVLALQDADDSIDAPIFAWEDFAIRRLGILTLKTINQFAETDQIINMRGEFHQLETLTYTGKMLEGQNSGDYFDVRVKTTSRQVLSRAGREARIGRLLELGVLNPQEHRDLVLEMLGSGDSERIFEESDPDRTRQWNEIKKMKEGQSIPVLAGENHKIHIEMVNKWMASGLRDDANEQQLQLVQQHYISHLKMQAAELVQQQQIAQMAMQGEFNVQNVNGQPGQQVPSRPGQSGGQPGGQPANVTGSIGSETGAESEFTGVGSDQRV